MSIFWFFSYDILYLSPKNSYFETLKNLDEGNEKNKEAPENSGLLLFFISS